MHFSPGIRENLCPSVAWFLLFKSSLAPTWNAVNLFALFRGNVRFFFSRHPWKLEWL